MKLVQPVLSPEDIVLTLVCFYQGVMTTLQFMGDGVQRLGMALGGFCWFQADCWPSLPHGFYLGARCELIGDPA